MNTTIPIIRETLSIMVIFLLFSMLLSSCKTVENVRTEYRDSIVYRNHIDTVLIYNQDSIIIKEKGDTILIEKWKTKYIDKIKIRTDTIYTERVKTEIEVVKEKYVPSFYKWCAFFSILIAVVVIIVAIWKIYKRFKL